MAKRGDDGLIYLIVGVFLLIVTRLKLIEHSNGLLKSILAQCLKIINFTDL